LFSSILFIFFLRGFAASTRIEKITKLQYIYHWFRIVFCFKKVATKKMDLVFFDDAGFRFDQNIPNVDDRTLVIQVSQMLRILKKRQRVDHYQLTVLVDDRHYIVQVDYPASITVDSKEMEPIMQISNRCRSWSVFVGNGSSSSGGGGATGPSQDTAAAAAAAAAAHRWTKSPRSTGASGSSSSSSSSSRPPTLLASSAAASADFSSGGNGSSSGDFGPGELGMASSFPFSSATEERGGGGGGGGVALSQLAMTISVKIMKMEKCNIDDLMSTVVVTRTTIRSAT
jgi:hypothetical protein